MALHRALELGLQIGEDMAIVDYVHAMRNRSLRSPDGGCAPGGVGSHSAAGLALRLQR